MTDCSRDEIITVSMPRSAWEIVSGMVEEYFLNGIESFAPGDPAFDRADNAVRPIKDALDGQVPSYWRTDLENAPRDGTRIDVVLTSTPSAKIAALHGYEERRERVPDAWWSEDLGWVSDSGDYHGIEGLENSDAHWVLVVTHWMLTPELPPIEE